MTAVSTAALVRPRPPLVLARGRAELLALEPALERLFASTAADASTATWGWVAASALVAAPAMQPWLVGIGDAAQLEAAALLVDRHTATGRVTTIAGTDDGHRGLLPCPDPALAGALAVAVVAALSERAGSFALGPLAPGPVADALLAAFSGAAVAQEVRIPQVVFGEGRPDGMSRGTSRTLRKAYNRLAHDGVTVRIEETDDVGDILCQLPRLQDISRERDIAGARISPLDDPARRAVWEARMRAVAGLGRLRLSSLLLDDQLAAYVLGIDDDAALRVFEGRYVGEWARYAPGRLLEAEVMRRAAAAGRAALDWMTAVAPETLLAANDEECLVLIRGAC